MAKNVSKTELDGGVKPGIPQFTTTAGNVISPVAGLSNDAGASKPPVVGPYGSVGDDSFPSGEKMPSGNSKAIGSFFGSKSPGGTK
jgi:hypothetical protein